MLAAREALLSFRRAPILSVLSVTTIAFALFVSGLFALLALNLQHAISRVEERVEVVMYLRRNTPVEAATLVMEDIETFPEVEVVSYISEEDALARARTELAEFQDIFGDLETNPLPASLEVRLQPGFRNSDDVRRVAERLRGFRFAEDVRFGRDWVANLDRLRDIAGAVVLLIGGAFALASVIIIGTTVRMAVLQRSREISIMRLVGATDGFIRLPFLLEGCIKGLLGGLLALGMNYGAFLAVSGVLPEGQFFSPPESLGVLAIGTALGFLASAASVARHLRQV